jgi:hypothetical protein
MTSRRQIDPTSIDYLYIRASMMSDESLREFAKQRGFEGAAARRELAKRDLQVGLAE